MLPFATREVPIIFPELTIVALVLINWSESTVATLELLIPRHHNIPVSVIYEVCVPVESSRDKTPKRAAIAFYKCRRHVNPLISNSYVLAAMI